MLKLLDGIEVRISMLLGAVETKGEGSKGWHGTEEGSDRTVGRDEEEWTGEAARF